MDRVDEMLDAMTPQEFDELVAWNEIEPIGQEPFYRLLVFMASCMANQFREEDKVTMEEVAEFAGIPEKQFKIDTSKSFASPESAAAMFRR